MGDLILTECSDNIFHIILNRPDKRNAMNWDLMLALDSALDEAERAFGQGVRVLVIRANGKAFSSGIDVSGLMSAADTFGDNWRENLFPMTAKYQGILNKLEHHSLPSICAMHGYCLGLGMELSLACDFRIIAEHTLYGLPETRLGIIPDVGGTTRLVGLVGPSRAKEIIMTGKNVKLDRAERWGLVNQIVPKDELLDHTLAFAADIMRAAPLAVSYTRRVVNEMMDTAAGQRLEAWAQAQLFRTKDFETGMQAMITKATDVEWEGK